MAEGGCHCGAVRYAVSGEAVWSALCNCQDCRRHAGAPLVGWTMFPASSFRLLKGQLTSYASSEHGRRHFCAACGTGVSYTNEEVFPGMVDTQTATLDDPDVYPPSLQIQVAERIGWMRHAHELPEVERYPSGPPA